MLLHAIYCELSFLGLCLLSESELLLGIAEVCINNNNNDNNNLGLQITRNKEPLQNLLNPGESCITFLDSESCCYV